MEQILGHQNKVKASLVTVPHGSDTVADIEDITQRL